jgi:hypothetical protein
MMAKATIAAVAWSIENALDALFIYSYVVLPYSLNYITRIQTSKLVPESGLHSAFQ